MPGPPRSLMLVAALAVAIATSVVIGACSAQPSPSPAPPAIVEPGPPLDPPATDPFPGTPWTLDGRSVSTDIVQLIAGPEHCDWQDILFLTMGWPLGREFETSLDARQYLRDPGGASAAWTTGRFGASVVPPEDAFFTGYRYGPDELWVSRTTVDDEVYLVRGSTVEAWPRATTIVGCD